MPEWPLIKEFMRTIIAPLKERKAFSFTATLVSRKGLPNPCLRHSSGGGGIQERENVQWVIGGGQHANVLVLEQRVSQRYWVAGTRIS